MSTAVGTEKTQYLTFFLDEEVYAANVENVKEVLEVTSFTKIPQMPPYMNGIINVRGSAVPVVDLRMKFGIPKTESSVNGCIIILELSLGDEEVVVGALVDSVEAVVDFDSENIDPPPKIGTKLNTDYIQGIGKADDRFIIILAINKIFGSDEIERLHETNRSSE